MRRHRPYEVDSDSDEDEEPASSAWPIHTKGCAMHTYESGKRATRRLTPERRDQIAADAAARYTAGESWQQIGADYGITGEHVRRLTTARHDITYRRWGRPPVADPQEVSRRRSEGQTLDTIAEALGCSRQAVRTALETTGQASVTRYPRLSERRTPTTAEVEQIIGLYEACPQAPRSRPGAHDMRGPEGRAVAEACHELVTDGVPMQTLSTALGRAATWVHWIFDIHDLRPATRATQSTARRTRPL